MRNVGIQAVLFDLDGTLVDTIADITAALNSALAHERVEPLSPEEGMTVVGHGLRNAIRGALALRERHVDEGRLEKLYGWMMDYYRNHPVVFSHPYPGVPETLAALQDRHVPLGIFSNKEDALTKEIVRTVLPDVPFSLVRGMQDGFPPKPDRSGVDVFCSMLGIPVEKTLYVGDSEVDWKTARNAGCLLRLVRWGFRKPEELMHLEDAHLIESMDELEELDYAIQ